MTRRNRSDRAPAALLSAVLAMGLATAPALAETSPRPALRLETSTPGDAGIAEAAKRGGTLTVGLMVQSECLDPQQHHHGFGSREGRQIVDSLTEQASEDATRIVPWLAKSWTINADATRYVFDLREDVTFSDGSALDAALVKANFETLAKIPGAAGSEYLSALQAIEVLSPHRLAISFKEPNIAFLAATATSELGVVASATLAKTADQRCYDGVIGSGPFVLESVKFNEQTVLVRRAGYRWASPLRKHQGDAFLDRLVFRVIPEASVRTGALKTGQVDFTNASYQDAPILEKAGFVLVNGSYVGTAATLFVNTSRPVVSDIEVRRALQQGIDRQEIVDLVQNGYVTPATGLLTPRTPGFLDLSREIAFDPAAAKARLDRAGWIPGKDGIRVKDGQPLRIRGSFWSNAINRALFELIQQQARELGIDFIVSPVPGSAEYLQGQINGSYDVYRWHWSLADPDVLRKDYSTRGLNRLRLPPTNDIDGPLFAQAGVTDPVARKALTDAAQRTIVDRAYGIPLFNPDNLWAANARVKDVSFGPSGTGGPHQLFYDAWIAK